MADTTHHVNARPYSPRVHAPSYDRLAAALDTPRVQEAMDKSRAILAGVRQERTEATYQQSGVFSSDAKQFRVWLWTVGITFAVLTLCFCGVALFG